MSSKAVKDELMILQLDIRYLVGKIEKQYELVIESIKQSDSTLAQEVIKNDKEINAIAEDIDLDTMHVIARLTPTPSYLRRFVMINKLAYELERVADYAKNIAQFVITGNRLAVKSYPIIRNLEQMVDVIFKMLETNLQAFLNDDRELARQALLMDKEIDQLYDEMFHELLTLFKETSDEDMQHMISKAMILNKQIERAGDHLTNISEQILSAIKSKRMNVW